MTVVVCPGIHSPILTQGFLQDLEPTSSHFVVFPAEHHPAYSAWHLTQFLEITLDESSKHRPLLLIGFSAGVVAAIATAYYWQIMGRSISALIAIDGWGVPLHGTFPIHRMSHDYFTHWSSSIAEHLGDCFYADPAIDHLDLWRSPALIQGRWVNHTLEVESKTEINSGEGRSPFTPQTTAADFLLMLLKHYGENNL